MDNMFNNATSFNQDLSSWDVSNVLSFSGMLDYCGVSQVNYDNLLVGWSGLTLQNGATFGAETLLYSPSPCAGGIARTNIINNYSWTFIGDSSGGCISILTTTNTGYILDTQTLYNQDQIIQSDVFYGYQYYMTTGDTYVFDSGGTYVTNVSRPIESQVFDTDLFKYYGSYNNLTTGTTRIYDVDLNLLTEIILTGCPNPHSSTYNSGVGKVGIIDSDTDKMAIIDSSTETLDGYIDFPFGGGYKAIITSDNSNNTIYVISTQNTLSPSGGTIYVVDPVTLTTGTTIPFTADPSSQVVSSIFNQTNGYLYILQSNGKLRWIETSTNTLYTGIILSYSGTYHSMTYDVNKDYLYISNFQLPNTQNIIVFRCSTNTEFNIVNSVQINAGEGVINYNPTTSLLWYASVGSDELISLST
jgi:hypothetical protein